jgi:hypothetical protein
MKIKPCLCSLFLILALHPAFAQLPTDINGAFPVTESWSVTVYLGNGSSLVPITYTGKESGTLMVTNGTYNQINASGVADISRLNTSRTIYYDGTHYDIPGGCPLSGDVGDSGSFYAIVPLTYFVIKVPIGSTGGFSLGDGGLSSEFDVSGTSLTSLTGSGTYVDGNAPDTTVDYVNEVDATSAASLAVSPSDITSPTLTTTAPKTGASKNEFTSRSVPETTLGVFGSVNGKATSLKVDFGSGSSAVFTLSGGTGTALQSGSEIDLAITASSPSAALSVAVKGGGTVPFGDIDVTGSLKSIKASASTIFGTLTISGSLGTATLGDISGNVAVAEGITSLTAGQLDGTLLAGGSVGKLKLGAVNGHINVAGNINSLTAGDVSGSIYTSGSLVSAKVGNVTGLIAAALVITSLQTLNITGATILAGVNLGADGQIGGTGLNADNYAAGDITTISAVGAIDNSFVGAGVAPGSSGFGSSNDTSAGTGLIKSISASGGATGSKFESSAFGTAKLPKKIDPATNPQFIVL